MKPSSTESFNNHCYALDRNVDSARSVQNLAPCLCLSVVQSVILLAELWELTRKRKIILGTYEDVLGGGGKYPSFLWRYSPNQALASSVSRFLNHTQLGTRGRTPGRVISQSQRPLPTQDNTPYQHKRQTSMPWVGFKHAIPATKRPQTYTLERSDTGIGRVKYSFIYLDLGIRWGLVVSLVAFDSLMVSVLAIGSKVRGFKPGGGRWVFKGYKKAARLPSEAKLNHRSPVVRFYGMWRSLQIWKEILLSQNSW
jgi:hypothetical protein